VGLALLGLAILLTFPAYTSTLAVSRHINERLIAQLDVRLAIDRIARALHETTLGFGRLRVYTAETGCSGTYQGCIGFVTARGANCAGSFHTVNGAPDWQATIYLWRDTTSDELRLGCDPNTTFPAVVWPGPRLEPSAIIGAHVVAASFILEPAGSPTPTSLAVALEEQIPATSGPLSRAKVLFPIRTVFLPQNR